MRPSNSRSLRVFSWICAALLIAWSATEATRAFFPTNLLAVGGLLGRSHAKITSDAIEELDVEFFALPKLTKSMKKAIEQIADANAEVDQDQVTSAKHFDAESFPEGQARLAALLTSIQNALADDDATGARSALGGALHTIQDFYSHSNWVELGNGGPHPGLGRPAAIGRLPATTATCQACTGGLPPILCPNCSNNLITGALTSGYYSGEDRVKPNADKCSHGGVFDGSASGLFGEGINKDSFDCTFSPHNFLHSSAAGVAKEATKQFIRDIKALVTERQLKLLLGVGPTLAISIDTTGSMGGIIDSVKGQAIQIVNARLGTDEEPSKYVLAPFNDPGVGPTTVTADVDVFKTAINSLFASGGGDCPELSMSGMLQALSASDDGGDLFMFTDASSLDGHLAGNVASLAASKDIKVYPMSFGSCSPVDPAYRMIADRTGGQLFQLFVSEAGEIARLADFVVRANVVNLLSIADELTGSAREYSVPVDSGMTRVTFSVSGSTSVAITRPGGVPVAGTDPDVSTVALSTGRIVSITTPATGAWGITLNGLGPFSLNVTGEGDLDLTSFRFVEERGRPGHSGMFPIAGLPVASVPTVTHAVMAGTFATANFELRHKTGAVLQTLMLDPVSTDLPNEFFGPVTPPGGTFLVYVTGIDENGVPYQRVMPSSVLPQTIQLLAPNPVELRPAMLTSYAFQVSNLGPAGTFRVIASDDKGFLAGVNPVILAIPANGSADVIVQLVPPLGTPQGTSDTLTVTVESTDPLGPRNFAIVTSIVGSSNTAPVANAGVAQTLECSSPQGASVRLDGSASTDGDNDPLTYRWTDASGAVVGTEAIVNVTAPLGGGTYTLTVDDGRGGTGSATVAVTVQDTVAPSIHAFLFPPILWPVNRNLVSVTAAVWTHDACTAAPQVRLVSISSNPDPRRTPDDIQGAAIGTDDRSFKLRAESNRYGLRIYTAVYSATDAAGNSKTTKAYAVVPGDNDHHDNDHDDRDRDHHR
jgi:hypothetical protein